MALILPDRIAPEGVTQDEAHRLLREKFPLHPTAPDAPGLLDDMWHLAGKLESLSGPDELYHLMRQFRRSYATSQLFEDSITQLDEEGRRRVGRILYQVIERHWQRDIATTTTLSAIASRLAPILADDPDIRRFHGRLETLIPEAGASLVSIIEPLCYVSMAQGMAGSFVANTRRMITDPHWRQEDYQDQLRYYGGVGQHALNIQRHMRQRPQELHLHDVGRVIAIYQDLIKRTGYRELAEQLKQDALAALATHELGASIRGEVEDGIERAAGWTITRDFIGLPDDWKQTELRKVGLGERYNEVEELLEEAQNTKGLTPEHKSKPAEAFLEEPEFKKSHIQSSLSENGVPERASVALSELAEIAVNDPPLFAAKMAAAEKVQAVAQPGRPFTLSHAQREKVRQRRDAGEKLGSIAESLGVTEMTISRIVRDVSRKKTNGKTGR
jgi:hypothetical protein